jgi:large subunit ribosomal protein L25
MDKGGNGPRTWALGKMEQARLEVQIREDKGKGAARALRRDGFIPAIVYGHRMEPTAIKLPERRLSRLLGLGGENVIINLEIGESEAETVMLKELQIDPVTRRIIHADFMRVSLEEQVRTHIPITLIGTASGVSEGGVQEFLLRELDIECQARKMPESIEIDVSSLNIGDQIRVRDVELDEGMTIFNDLSTIIVTIATPTVIRVEEEEEIAVEEAEEMEPEVIGEKREEEEAEEE